MTKTVTAICYGLAFESSVLGTVKLVFFTVAVEFLVCGSLVASLTWFCTNKFMVEGLTLQSVDHGVEYLYCFDGKLASDRTKILMQILLILDPTSSLQCLCALFFDYLPCSILLFDNCYSRWISTMHCIKHNLLDCMQLLLLRDLSRV